MKKNIYLKTLAVMLSVAAAVSFWSCGDDDDVYKFSFVTPALYFTEPGSVQTSHYVASNVRSVEVTTVPEGWTATVDTKQKSVTVTAPLSLEPAEEKTPVASGTLKIRGYSGGEAVVATLYVAMAEVVDYTSAPANCYVVSGADKGYRIDVSRIPGSDRRIEPASVECMWMTSSKMLQYLTLHDDGTASFFAPADDGKVYPGSALIGAYDEAGGLLWCWHLWVADFDPEENPVALNGKVFMSRNLGSFSDEATDQTSILDSYGLYYQWGRPTPFMRPRYYNCASGYSTYVYNGNGSQIYMSVEEAQPGQSMAYAMENPLVFLTDLSGWDVETWVDDRKSSYDPCPAGWRVPQSDAFDGLSISPEELGGDAAALREAYGWTLTDGAQSAFFFAGGRRSYLDGMVVNLNTAERPEPWAGFYWTSGRASADGKHGCMFFELDTDDAEQSTMSASRELQMSNGLQIRCVKE